jgi:hypothetical protein
MIQAGMSEGGYVRLQSLTHGLESGIKQSVLRTREDSPNRMLVLIRQTQPNHPDIYVKQQWVVDDGQWKLEEEEKKSASPASDSQSTTSNAAPSTIPQASSAGANAGSPGSQMPTNDNTQTPSSPPASTDAKKPNVLSLPGISH